jgi:hypothetical protein
MGAIGMPTAGYGPIQMVPLNTSPQWLSGDLPNGCAVRGRSTQRRGRCERLSTQLGIWLMPISNIMST